MVSYLKYLVSMQEKDKQKEEGYKWKWELAAKSAMDYYEMLSHIINLAGYHQWNWLDVTERAAERKCVRSFKNIISLVPSTYKWKGHVIKIRDKSLFDDLILVRKT